MALRLLLEGLGQKLGDNENLRAVGFYCSKHEEQVSVLKCLRLEMPEG